jgi:hypothetical protein
MQHLQKAGEYLRFGSALSRRVSEFATLCTVRTWRQQFEWIVHAELARKEGTSERPSRPCAKAGGPREMNQEEAFVYDFVTELTTNHGVADATYREALERLANAASSTSWGSSLFRAGVHDPECRAHASAMRRVQTTAGHASMKRMMFAAAVLVVALGLAHARTASTSSSRRRGEMQFIRTRRTPDTRRLCSGDPKGRGSTRCRQGCRRTHDRPHTHGEKWRIAPCVGHAVLLAGPRSTNRNCAPGAGSYRRAHDMPHFARTNGEPSVHIVGE